MEPDKNIEVEKKKGTVDGVADKLIDKAEDFIDELLIKFIKANPTRKQEIQLKRQP